VEGLVLGLLLGEGEELALLDGLELTLVED